MHRRPSALALAALAAVPLLLTACGTTSEPPGIVTPSGSGTPTSSSSPSTGDAVTDLAAARAAWEQSPARTGEYQMRVMPSCFCARVGVDVTVTDGTVTREDAIRADGDTATASPTADPTVPRTVEDLLDVVDRAGSAHSRSVTYSREGVPLRIDVDPIENAVDDEYSYTVQFSTMEGDREPTAPDGSWRVADPTGTPPGLDATGLPSTGTVAYIDGTGAGAVLRLGLWGSGSCPSRPVTLEPREPADGVLTLLVDVDGTEPPGTACTADYGPTWYATAVPSAVTAALATDGTRVEVLIESVAGTTGSTGSGATTAPVLR